MGVSLTLPGGMVLTINYSGSSLPLPFQVILNHSPELQASSIEGGKREGQIDCLQAQNFLTGLSAKSWHREGIFGGQGAKLHDATLYYFWRYPGVIPWNSKDSLISSM